MTKAGARTHLHPLTSLRFFAAFLVLGFHVGGEIWLRAPWWLSNFFSNGYDAVSFFFILSGFVLSYTYGENTGTKTFAVGPWVFWRARFARIYPAYLLGLAIALPSFLYSLTVAKMISLPDFLTGFILVPALCQAWWPASATAWNVPAWSLSVEAFFYLSFPFFIRRLAKTGPLKFFTGALVTVIVVSLLRNWLATSPEIAWTPAFRHNFVAYFPLLFLPHFIFGMALSRCFSHSHTILSLCLNRLAIPSALVLVVLFCARSKMPAWLVSDAFLVPLFGVVIFGTAHATGRVASILSWNPLVQLGEASYALYILHVPLAFWFRWAALRAGFQPFDHWLGVATFAALSVVISYAVFIWVERPGRRLILHRLGNA